MNKNPLLEICLLCWSFGATDGFLAFGPLVVFTRREGSSIAGRHDVRVSGQTALRLMRWRGFLLGIDIAMDGFDLFFGPVSLGFVFKQSRNEGRVP